jgi:hypothetical protein
VSKKQRPASKKQRRKPNPPPIRSTSTRRKPAPPPIRSTSGRAAATSGARRRWWWWALGAAVAAGVLGIVLASGLAGTKRAASASLPLGSIAALGRLEPPGNPGPLGPEGVPVPNVPQLAPAASLQPGQSVDGVGCRPLEQLAFHIHAHLTVFFDGRGQQIPAGVGIGAPVGVQQTPQGPFAASGACFSWLHTHAADGIIHIESPVQRVYTLGDFFDVWHVQLGPGRVGASYGRVTAFFNGRPFEGNPRRIPLLAHAQIQLDVGRPLVAPESIHFPNGL